MKTAIIAFVLSVSFAGSLMAQETCATKAVDKNGKALNGAALNSFMKKCKTDTCSSKAIDKNGKPLAGAAKNSFIQKCEKDA